MAVVYILHSRKLDRFYTGSCADFDTRYDDHLHKAFPRSFTSSSEDWLLFLLIENLTYTQARAIEKHIKKMHSKIYIQNLLKYPEMVSRLKAKYA